MWTLYYNCIQLFDMSFWQILLNQLRPFPNPWFYLYMDIWKIKKWMNEKRLASNEIFSPSNKIHREVGRAKDLSAAMYTLCKDRYYKQWITLRSNEYILFFVVRVTTTYTTFIYYLHFSSGSTAAAGFFILWSVASLAFRLIRFVRCTGNCQSLQASFQGFFFFNQSLICCDNIWK